MAEEFHAGICGETWWDSSKAMFMGCSSPCSTGLAADMGSFGWSADMVDIKARSSCEESKDSLAFPLGAQQVGVMGEVKATIQFFKKVLTLG
ncbi:transcription factor bHLH112-like protein [Gossypium australe]|uniref:Transcription factor bHLH112-like protein n=1 Tax=Gossypium australe TaxID=47621 RepID=A0A5B6X7Y1_9ROSI|nr:transcription factor bHLH112-like protein [Gossypium australe]